MPYRAARCEPGTAIHVHMCERVAAEREKQVSHAGVCYAVAEAQAEAAQSCQPSQQPQPCVTKAPLVQIQLAQVFQDPAAQWHPSHGPC